MLPQLRRMIIELVIWWIGDALASSLVWSTLGILENLLEGSSSLAIQGIRISALIIINAFSIWKTLRDIREHLSPYHGR